MIYIGIDQTGSYNISTGKAKPLPVVVIYKDQIYFQMEKKPLQIPSLKVSYLRDLLVQLKLPQAPVFCLVDCVLGLGKESWPKNLSKNAENRFFELAAETLKIMNPPLGKKAAQSFFASFPIKTKRQIETLYKANSVFQTTPFQKNIQTGTFRIWKDLADQKTETQIWPYYPRYSAKKVWLAEGYPSLYWRKLGIGKSRKWSFLQEYLKKSKYKLSGGPLILSKDANLQDSLVLALYLAANSPSKLKVRKTALMSWEGAIW